MNQELHQIPAASLKKKTWEVIVVGGGPAGAVCAGILAKHGHEVLVIDKKQFPREKACGDLLMADSQAVLKEIALLEEVRAAGNRVAKIRVFSPSQYVFDAPGDYVTLYRKNLDSLLIQKACVHYGVVFSRGEVTGVKSGSQNRLAVLQVKVSDKRTVSLQAKIVVLATGGVPHLPYSAGLIENREPYAVALRGYVHSDYYLNDVIISYDTSILPGYGWIVPMGADVSGGYLYNIGCGRRYGDNRRSLKQIFQTFLVTFPLTRQIVTEGEQPQQVMGAPLRCNLPISDKKQEGTVLAIGEAVGTTFPFTGEGVGTAMQSGLIAADIIHRAIVTDDMSLLRQYAETLNKTMKPLYSSYKKAERWLSYPRLNDFVAKRIASSKHLQCQVQRFINAESSPDSVFGLKSILLSYFK